MKKNLTVLILFLAFLLPISFAEPGKSAIEFYNAGIDYYQAGNIQKSIESFQSAITASPDFYEAYYNMAQIQFASNKLDDAIKTYTKISTLRPDDDENNYSLAHALYKRGYLSRALSYYKKVPQKSSFYSKTQEEMTRLVARQEELRLEAQKKKEEEELRQKISNNVSVEQAVSAPKEQQVIKPVSDLPAIIKSYTYRDISAPAGIGIDSTGNMYVASFSDNTIYRFDENLNKVVFLKSDMLQGPVGVTVDKFDNVYVANYTKGNILRVTKNGIATEITKVKNPYFMTIKDGYMYVSEQAANSVLKYKLY